MGTINLVDFSGGMNQHSSPDLIGINQSPLIVNMNLDQNGNVATRTGTDMLVNVSGTGYIRGLGIQERVTDIPRLWWTALGNLYYYYNGSWINKVSASVGTATMTIAAPAVVTKSTHGLITGDDIYFTTSGALPTGVVSGTVYYAIRIDADTFNLASSYDNAIAGTKITTTGTQSGTHTLYKYTDHIMDGYDIDFCSFQGCLYYLGIGVASNTVPAGITWTRAGTDALTCTAR